MRVIKSTSEARTIKRGSERRKRQKWATQRGWMQRITIAQDSSDRVIAAAGSSHARGLLEEGRRATGKGAAREATERQGGSGSASDVCA